MTREELTAKMDQFRNDMKAVMDRKNKDYAHDGDALLNFALVEHLRITTRPRGILVRMSDKMARICNLIEKEGAVTDESIYDTLVDLSNYSGILAAALGDKTRGE